MGQEIRLGRFGLVWSGLVKFLKLNSEQSVSQ